MSSSDVPGELVQNTLRPQAFHKGNHHSDVYTIKNKTRTTSIRKYSQSPPPTTHQPSSTHTITTIDDQQQRINDWIESLKRGNVSLSSTCRWIGTKRVRP